MEEKKENKIRRINLTLTQDEYDLVSGKARQQRRAVTNFIRHTLLEALKPGKSAYYNG